MAHDVAHDPDWDRHGVAAGSDLAMPIATEE